MTQFAPVWVLASALGCSVGSPALTSVYVGNMESLESGKDSNFLVQARLYSVGGRSRQCSVECPLMKAVFGGTNPLPPPNGKEIT